MRVASSPKLLVRILVIASLRRGLNQSNRDCVADMRAFLTLRIELVYVPESAQRDGLDGYTDTVRAVCKVFGLTSATSKDKALTRSCAVHVMKTRREERAGTTTQSSS